MLTHKEMTAHIRSRLKHEGIKSRCSLYTACGAMWIRISPPAPHVEFTPEECKKIQAIVEANKLRGACNSELLSWFPPLGSRFQYRPEN